MSFRKIGFITLLFVFIYSCDKHSDKNKLNTISKPIISNQKIEHSKQEDNEEIDYNNLDTIIRKEIKILDSKFPSTPFYGFIEGKKYFIVSTNKFKSIFYNSFNSSYKYGIVNDSLNLVLDQKYDKIYNPNLVILNCFEIKKADKIGLFNYETKQILLPQFDFIIPSSNTVTNIAYGYKDKLWFEIINSDLSIKKIDFNPITLLGNIHFDLMKIDKNMMFFSYHELFVDGLESGYGVGIVPSYIEYLHLLPNNFYLDIVNNKSEEWGTDSSKINKLHNLSLSEKIKAFVINAYETGSDSRGYEIKKKQVVFYNNESNDIDTLSMGLKNITQSMCKENDSFKMVNDSIFEIKTNNSTLLYDDQPVYSYVKISKGKVQKLKSNRIFDFTKYINIEDSYFAGCYVKSMKDEELRKRNYMQNVWVSEYLTLEDLDIMRNEIYADYGLIFKSSKWKQYFKNKLWYVPKYENVDRFLTPIDSLNIITILKAKIKVNKNEVIKKHADLRSVAG